MKIFNPIGQEKDKKTHGTLRMLPSLEVGGYAVGILELLGPISLVVTSQRAKFQLIG